MKGVLFTLKAVSALVLSEGRDVEETPDPPQLRLQRVLMNNRHTENSFNPSVLPASRILLTIT